jgi:hypothetical protein
VFVHVLRVDTAGHHHGADSDEYRAAARDADAIARRLVAAAPDARWFLLSDHGHLPTGGHGGEERDIRQVLACVAGPGVARASGGPVAMVDVARAVADSTGAKLDPASLGRPLGAALAAPLAGDQAVPALALTHGAIALIVIALGLAVSSWSVRKWWLAPWWLPIAGALLVAIRGEPTLSMPMIYARDGVAMSLAWLPALVGVGVATWLGRRRTTLARIVVAQLALPVAVLAAAITASGGWPTVTGDDVAAVVPRYTAWVSPLALIAAQGAAAVALGLLATLVRRGSGRPSPPEPARSAPAAG